MFSRTFVRSAAAWTFCRGVSRGATGNGVFARRSFSVLPPPSRFACARISAFTGFDADLALTSATTSGGPLSLSLPDPIVKCNVIAIACNASDMATAMPNVDIRRGVANDSGGMRAGGRAPANARRALRCVPWTSGAGSPDLAARSEKLATASELAGVAIATSVAITFAPCDTRRDPTLATRAGAPARAMACAGAGALRSEDGTAAARPPGRAESRGGSTRRGTRTWREMRAWGL